MVMQAVGSAVFSLLAPFAAESGSLSATDIAYAVRQDGPLHGRTALYDLWWDYYRGRQRDPNGELTVNAPRTFAAAHNFAGVAIDVVVERLQVTGFEVAGEALAPGEAAAIAAQCWRWWQHNRMDEHQGTLHARALAQADAYLVLGWDAQVGVPVFRFHDAGQVTPVYLDGAMVAAYKVWTQPYRDAQGLLQVRYRLTKYLPDRIEKFFQDRGRWQRWTEDTDSLGVPDGGVVAWVDREGRPLGIPVVHFRNKPRGEDFGFSDIADLVAPQDSINRRIAALDEASTYQGAAQWYGVDLNAEALKKNPPQVGPGTLMVLQSLSKEQRGSVGHFPPGEVEKLMSSVVGAIKVLAALARTPMHLLFPEGGVPPSGESLKTAEAGLVAKALDRQTVFGNPYEDLMALSVRLHNTFSDAPSIREDVTLSTQWRNPATRSDLADEQVVALRREDLSWEEAMRERGFDAERITQIKTEREAEERASRPDTDRAAVVIDGAVEAGRRA